jgi:hypothetical protein
MKSGCWRNALFRISTTVCFQLQWLLPASDDVCGKAGLMTEAARGVTERDNAAAQGKKFVTSLDNEDIKVAVVRRDLRKATRPEAVHCFSS